MPNGQISLTQLRQKTTFASVLEGKIKVQLFDRFQHVTSETGVCSRKDTFEF